MVWAFARYDTLSSRTYRYHTCTATTSSMLLAVLVSKRPQQQSFSSFYSSDDVKVFPGTWSKIGFVPTYYYRMGSERNMQKSIVQTHWRQRLPADKERQTAGSLTSLFFLQATSSLRLLPETETTTVLFDPHP